MTDTLALMREVLDHELLDVDGVTCGIVDDIVFEQETGKAPVVIYLLVGPGAWSTRLPALLIVLLRWMHATRAVRVPWQEVEEVHEVVRLRKPASALGLGVMDRKLARWLARLPGS